MNNQYTYPLHASFKIATLGNRYTLSDGQGNTIAFIKQKMFKLREDIQIFSDDSRTNLLMSIKSNKIIDWSANYTITAANGAVIGSVRRQGTRSIWRASFQIFDATNQPVFAITELNPWAKVLDALLSEVPIVGFFTGFFFHPKYAINTTQGQLALQVTKEPAFFEGKYEIAQGPAFDHAQQELLLSSMTMLILLERLRG